MVKKLLTALVLCALSSGCVSTNYQNVQPDFLGSAMVLGDAPLVVVLEPMVPGKPFSQTISDNAAGVTWSAEESQHIGFTQDYATLLVKNPPQPGVSLPHSPGLINVESRLMVPFGRLISENLKQALGQAGQVCEDPQCVRLAKEKWPDVRVVDVTFTALRVAEEDRNKLMLEVAGEAQATGGHAAPRSVALHHRINESVTRGGMSNMVPTMNAIANANATAIVNQVLAAGH